MMQEVEGRSYDSQQTDEIDLRQLLLKIWAVRVPVVVTLMLVTCVYWGFWAIKKFNAPNTYTYSRIIQFTFKGIENQEYPNGSPYRLADVMAPSILSLAYNINDLDEYNIAESDFVQRFNIQPYAPDYNLIVKRYDKVLSNKRIKPEQIDTLQKRLQAELAQASIGSAQISFTPRQKRPLPKTLIDKILLDIPRLWAERAIETHGVAELDVPIYSNKIFNINRFESLDYLVSLGLLRDNIKLVLENIQLLLELPNGNTVKDLETGYTLPDLKKSITDIVSYDLQALLAPVLDLGITKNTDAVLLHYQYKVRKLTQQRDFLDEQAEIISTSLDQYSRVVYGEHQDNSGNPPTGQHASSTVPQLGDDFIDRIITMADQGKDLEYRQKLSDQILELRHQAASINFQIKLDQTILNSIKDRTEEDAVEFKQHYLDLLQKSFPVIIAQLQDYVAITNRIAGLLSKENLGYSGALYRPGGSSTLTVSTDKLITKQDIIIYTILMFFTLFSTLLVAMSYRALQHNLNKD